MNPIFQAYREYVAKCIVEGIEPKTLTEFTGSEASLKIEDEVES